jgi:hypothetical protein
MAAVSAIWVRLRATRDAALAALARAVAAAPDDWVAVPFVPAHWAVFNAALAAYPDPDDDGAPTPAEVASALVAFARQAAAVAAGGQGRGGGGGGA